MNEGATGTTLSPATERELRLSLWMSHGHTGQYGDDGEMQCSMCIPFGVWDYRRASFEEILATHRAIGMARLAENKMGAIK